MFKKNLAVLATVLLLGFSFAQASQEQSEQRRPPKATKYEKFLDRTGVFVLSRTYMIGKTTSLGTSVWAMVAWAPGESDKVYAVRVGSVVDFDEIKEFEQELDKIIQTVNSFVDKPDWSSMRYQSLNGLELNFGTLNDDGGPQRYLNLTYRGTLIASGSGSQSLLQLQLRELRNLTSQAREKLISLGAK